MSLIKIWTTTKQSSVVDATFGPAFASFGKGKAPPNKFELFSEGWTPTPPEGGVLLVCGDKLQKELAAQGVFPKGRSVNWLREKKFAHANGGVYMVTYDPNQCANEPDKKVLAQWDLKLAARQLWEGTLVPKIGKYVWVSDFAQTIARIEECYAETGKPVDIACDLETMGFSPFVPGKRIVSLSVTLETGTAEILYTGPKFESPTPTDASTPLKEQIIWLLTSPKVKTRWANGKFDMIWLRKDWGIECTNFSFDACLVGSLIEENRSCSLNVLTKVYDYELGGYDDTFNDNYDKGKFEDIPPNDDFLTYAGGDTDATQRVSDNLKQELLKDPALANFYVNCLHPAARAFEKMEYRGVHVNREAYENLKDDLSTALKGFYKEAIQALPRRLRMKHMDKIESQMAAGKNPLTPKIKSDYFFDPAGLNLKPKMFTGKTQAISTAAAHFELFEDEPSAQQMIHLIKEMSLAEKALQTYVVGFMKHLHVDDRFHPSYFLYHGKSDWDNSDGGTVTGRLSAKGPAFQCMVGETMVLTDQGEKRLDWLVDNDGAGLKVLTHTGHWRDIVGVYRNGVQPIFRIETQSGKVIRCTGNHPILTPQGWVRADQITTEHFCYVREDQAWTHSKRKVSYVPKLGGYETPDFWERSAQSVLPALHYLPKVGEFRKLSGGHGGEASGDDSGQGGQYQGVHEDQLSVGHSQAASAQPLQRCVSDGEWGHQAFRSVGQTVRTLSPSCKVSYEEYGDDFRASSKDSQAAEQAEIFYKEKVISVTLESPRHTYDLTIDKCHSFVANGVVVHNTIPKHHPWAKRLRECFPAPEGYVMFEIDFSQGELRVAACVAPDPGMIAAYKEGMDLHAITGALAAHLTYEDVLELKKGSAEDKKYAKDIRQGGKAGNFGLLYGMQAPGFVNYAQATYGVTMSVSEATHFRDAFFDKWKGLLPYHDRMEKTALNTQQVRSPLGRVRHLPQVKAWASDVKSKALRQAINSPIQSCLSDMMLLLITALENEFDDDDLHLVGTVHDSCVGYVREDKAKELILEALEIGRTLPYHKFDWHPELEFPLDAAIGPDMSDLTEIADLGWV